jgi:uncharacterized membrane protein
MATRLRSFTKAITYRLSGSCITAAITFWATGKLDLALGVGLADVTSKLIFYYIHERLWDHFNWGRVEASSDRVASDLSLEQLVEVRSCGPSTASAVQRSSEQASQQLE